MTFYSDPALAYCGMPTFAFTFAFYWESRNKSTLGPKISSSLNLLILINVGKLEESTLIDPDLDREYLMALLSSKLPSVSKLLNCA